MNLFLELHMPNFWYTVSVVYQVKQNNPSETSRDLSEALDWSALIILHLRFQAGQAG